jgi:hypothetical protein
MSNKQEPVEDFLDEDTEIPGQRYVLLSFLSPEKVLDKKELFFFQKFLHAYEVDWKVKNLEKYLVETVKGINAELDEKVKELEKNDQFDSAAICRKNRLPIDNIMASYTDIVQKNKNDLNKTKIVEAYDDFMYTHKTKLEEQFHVANDCHTTMRGVKVRGVYNTTKEAELKAKKLQNKDKYHNIFMGEVGKWTPWDPSPHEVQDQDYNNDQLNNLMKKYKENEDSREQFFEERTKNSKKVVGVPTENAASSAGQFDGMFGGKGDLAFQRKVEKAEVTIEKVVDASQNVIVNPSS